MGFKEIISPKDLSHPQLSISWLVGGVVAAVLVIVVFLVATKGVGAVQTMVPASTSVMAPVRTYMS